jgi:hypothetical protein
MAAERQSRGRWKAKVVICAIVFFLSGSFIFAAEQGIARYRVFSLKHISAEQGKKYLADAGLGTVSQLPDVNALLVTAQAEELIKASAVLNLVDTEQLFGIKAITPASGVVSFPSNEQIAAEVNDISIGTFANPPSGAAKAKAIIDVHGDNLIVIAPQGQLERVISAIEHLRGSEAQSPQSVFAEATPDKVAEPNKLPDVNNANEAETKTSLVVEPTEAELEKAGEEA